LIDLTRYLLSVETFEGLTKDELAQIASICVEKTLQPGELLTTQGVPGDELFIITRGFVEILVNTPTEGHPRALVNLGPGQIIGEMALVDKGPRSATVRALSEPTVVQVIKHHDFDHLCQAYSRIGYIVMRNLAIDLSFKLRHQNLREHQS
jgi:CRP/FNR family transcriptional regulator, cyclic AMP receptor protein